MPLPTPADLRDRTKKHSQVREMLAQMAENVESKEGAQEKANAVLDRAKQIATEELGTTDARLLHSIQVILNAIVQFRNDYDESLINLNSTMSSNIEQQNSSSAINADNISRLNVGFNVLAHALQQAADDITEVSNQVINAEASLQSKILNSESSAHTNITRLSLSISQLVKTIAENRDEIDATITTVSADQQQNIENILKLAMSVQKLALSIHETALYAKSLDDNDNVQKRNLMQLMAWQELYPQLVKLDGFDPALAGAGGSPTETEDIIIFSEPKQLIRIDVSALGTLPTAKGTVLNSTTALTIDGQVLNCFSTLEVQGSSSASFPKKNWTISFFKDDSRTTGKKIKIGYMLEHSELVFKANFVDNTHCRNLAMNKLWHQMCESRHGFPKFEPDFANLNSGVGLQSMPTGATGHVDGYPAVLYLNGFFYGLGSLNIGKKRENYNLKSNDQNHIQLDPEGSVNLYNFPVDPTLGGLGNFDIRRPSTWGEQAQDNYLRLRDFLKKSQSDMAALGIDNYINRKNMMDYIILCQVCHLWDHLHKNTLYTTWDGQIWSFMPYDLDTVWGLHFLGNYYLEDGVTERNPATELLIPAGSANNNWGTLAKFRNIYGDAIDERYKQLREEKIIDLQNVFSICEKLARTYPYALFAADDTRWNTVPGGTIYQTLQQTGSLKQIYEWLSVRIPLCDAYFNYSV